MDSLQYFSYFIFVVFVSDIGFYVIHELLRIFNWKL